MWVGTLSGLFLLVAAEQTLVEIEVELAGVVRQSRRFGRFGEAVSLLGIDKTEVESFRVPASRNHDSLGPPKSETGFKLPTPLSGVLSNLEAGGIPGLGSVESTPLRFMYHDTPAQNFSNFHQLGNDTLARGPDTQPNVLQPGLAPTLTQKIRVPMKRAEQRPQVLKYGMKDISSQLELAASSLASFLEIEGDGHQQESNIGLVADYDFDTGELSSQGGVAGPLVDIGAKCNKAAKWETETVMGEQKKVLSLMKGTGLEVPGIQDLLGSGTESHYTISLRVLFEETEGYRRLLNVNFGDDNGVYVNKVLRAVPDRGGVTVLSAGEWHDIHIFFGDGSAKFMVDGIVDKFWQVSPENTGMMIASKSLVFFNDDGSDCSSHLENTAAKVARIRIYDRFIPEEFALAGLNQPSTTIQQPSPDDPGPFQELYDCVCPPEGEPDDEGRLKCVCESYCTCRGPPSNPPPPQEKWSDATGSTWTWRYEPHKAWADWYGNTFHALAGSVDVPMNMLVKFTDLGKLGQSGTIKVWSAELFLFFAQRGRTQRITTYPLSTNWNPWYTSWNNAPAATGAPLCTAYVGNLMANQWAVCSGSALVSQVQDWVNNRTPNNGLMVQVTEEYPRSLHEYAIVGGASHPTLRPRIRLWVSNWN